MKTRRKVLVFMCEGGGGHKTAADSLQEILGPHYEVEAVNVLTEIFSIVDFPRFTFGLFTGEEVYNLFLRKGLHRTVALLTRAGIRYIHFFRKVLEREFIKRFNQKGNETLALVISTVPKFNAILCSATSKCDLPFLLIPTDLDTDTFLVGMNEIDFKEDEKFKLAIPYDDPDLYLKIVLESNLKSKHFSVTGFPIRPACQKKYSPEEVRSLKEKHGMDAVRKTITLMMGAVGGDVLFRYVKEFTKITLPFPVQINVCIGRNKRIGKKILKLLLSQNSEIVRESEGCQSLLTAKGVLLHIRSYTKEVTEIMAASDLVITKTGSCSVNEVIYLGRKLLLDNTKYSSARHIWWERFNVAFVKKHNLGDALFDFKELGSKVTTLLDSDAPHPTATGSFRVPNFQENIASLAHNMINGYLAETKAPRSAISSLEISS